MFVKQLRLSRSELHFCGSNFEVVQQIANLKVLNISERRRDVSALVFLAVRLTKTGKEQRKGGNVERCVLAMSKLGIVAASRMEIRHTCRWYDGCGPHELWHADGRGGVLTLKLFSSSSSTLEDSLTSQSPRIHQCTGISHVCICGQMVQGFDFVTVSSWKLYSCLFHVLCVCSWQLSWIINS